MQTLVQEKVNTSTFVQKVTELEISVSAQISQVVDTDPSTLNTVALSTEFANAIGTKKYCVVRYIRW